MAVVLQTVTITRSLQEDGTETYRVDHDDMGWLEALGLLEAAKFHFYERFRGGDED